MLFLLPVVSPDIYINEQSTAETQLSIISTVYNEKKSWKAYQLVFNSIIKDGLIPPANSGQDNFYPILKVILPDPEGEPFNDDLIKVFPNEDKIESQIENMRKSDYSTKVTVTDNDIEMIIIYSTARESKFEATINLCRTLYVTIVLAISAVFFSSTANKLVLHPLERMLEIVKKIAKNPSSASASDEMQNAGIYTYMKQDQKEKIDQNLETAILENAIQKIGHLLILGFGDAGSSIIAQNMTSGGDMNPLLPGTKTFGIFGFCFVHNFLVCTEVLQKDVMVFVNQIAEITHTAVAKYGGSANKNLGDAYLLIWKYDDPNELNTTVPFEEKNFSQDNRNCADMALFSYIKILARINKYSHIRKYRQNQGLSGRIENYKVRMGFGLHTGWAIEGAIGSFFKIDASYLSPNINLAARLEVATLQYGV